MRIKLPEMRHGEDGRQDKTRHDTFYIHNPNRQNNFESIIYSEFQIFFIYGENTQFS